MTALTTLTAWFALGLAGVAPSQAQSYTITVLPVMPNNGLQGSGFNNNETWAAALNNLGEAVGESDEAGSQAAYNLATNTATLWSNGQAISLGALPLRGGPPGGCNVNANTCFDTSTAYGINNSGQVTGTDWGYTGTNTPPHAWLYSNGKMIDIHNGSLFPLGTYALAINASGQIVGHGALGGAGPSQTRAFLYSAGTMVYIDLLPGTTNNNAFDINDVGEIVGTSGPTPFLFSNGQMSALPVPSFGGVIDARINGNGQILAEGGGHLGLFSNGTWTDLGLPAGVSSIALGGINLSGEIVGSATIPGVYRVKPTRVNIPGRIFGVIRLNGAWVDLNTLIPANSGHVISQAWAINDSGQILCSDDHGGVPVSLLLTPE